MTTFAKSCCGSVHYGDEPEVVPALDPVEIMVTRKQHYEVTPQAGLLTSFTAGPKVNALRAEDEESTTTGAGEDTGVSDSGSRSESPIRENSFVYADESLGLVLEPYQKMAVPTPHLQFMAPNTLCLSVRLKDVEEESPWPITKVRVCLRFVEGETLWVLHGEQMAWVMSDLASASTAGSPVTVQDPTSSNPVVTTTADVTGREGGRFHACIEAFNGNEWQWGEWSPCMTVPDTIQ
mmetsp:Transcript_26623/g.64113  ORF Transcript_26623/g.64113 Transcript_26623/m.64113 type:complete len:236 (+) Transcript_26623:47-754(+)